MRHGVQPPGSPAHHPGADRRPHGDRATEDDLRTLFHAAVGEAYEDSLVLGATMEDLDPEVVATYRRGLLEASPGTELREASDDQLVLSVGGAVRSGGALVPTVAGVLVFGKALSLRRIFPALRVDYVRVPGTTWVPDPNQRFDTVEIRAPLLAAFRRAYGAVSDDLPRTFTLEPGSPERKDRLAIPEAVLREVLVNALTHRSYRIQSAIQVLRFNDRIEVRNPGHSRDVTDLDPIQARRELHGLRTHGLLRMENQRGGAYYVLEARAAFAVVPASSAPELESERVDLGPDRGDLSPDRGDLGPDRGDLGADRGGPGPGDAGLAPEWPGTSTTSFSNATSRRWLPRGS